MATYDDYDGVFFTIQSLRMHSLQNVDFKYEFIVLDNNPNSESGKETRRFVTQKLGDLGKYIPYPLKATTFNKYQTIKHCSGEYCLILDCHVLLATNALQRLVDYMSSQECDEKDLLQGPLWYDDLRHVSTHFEPVWRGQMYGIWATNHEAYNRGEPFEIPMQGMGLCAFHTRHFPVINQHFRGFGGEEGYIAEKFRMNGGKNLCLPWLKWNHRFARPLGVKYPLVMEDKIFNYYLGWGEIYGKDSKKIEEIEEHFLKEIKSWKREKYREIRERAFALLEK